jgi:hypothetical protein
MRRQVHDFGLGMTQAWWKTSMKLWEVSLAAPQVIALRVAQLSTGIPFSSPGAIREAAVMGPEKVAAFVEGWQAMMLEGVQLQQKMLQQAMGQWWQFWMSAWTPGAARAGGVFRASVVPASGAHSRPMAHAAARIADAGIAPVHRRVTNNVRRLSSPKKGR